MQSQATAALKTQHDKDMQFYKLQMDVKNSKSTGDKIMGVLVNPNLPQVIASLGNALNGQPTAVGRLGTEGSVPAPRLRETAQVAQPSETTETAPAFDPDTLTPQQREMYDKGLKINALLAKVQERFPDSDPLESLENGVNMIVKMDDDTLNQIAFQSL